MATSLSDLFKLQIGGFPPTTSTSTSPYGSLSYRAPSAPVLNSNPNLWGSIGSFFSSANAKGQAALQNAQTQYQGKNTIGVMAPVVAPTAPATTSTNMTQAQRDAIRAQATANRTSTPTPVFSGSTPTVTTSRNQPAVFTGSNSSVPAQTPVNPEYIKPDGTYYTADEVVANRVARLQGGAIPNFAGNTLTEGPQTTEQLQTTAAGLNNARNDIATGATDPYKAATASGVAYSPQELKAIESAYAGVYDPAINSALAKLDAKQKADSAKTDADLWAQKQVFQTNENIRQWRATTGTTASSDGNFTSTQTNKGASAAGLPIATFDALDPDIKNYFVNTPYGKDPVTGAKTLKTQLFNDLMKEVSAGTISPEDAATEITNSDLPEAVKQYYIEQMPLAPEVKNGFIDNIWNWFTGKQ